MDTQTYKHIANYLRNELGINREVIAEIVDKSIKNRVKQSLEELTTDNRIEKVIRATVESFITDNSSTWNSSSTKDKFAKAVLAEVKKAVGQIMSKDFEISFDVKKISHGGEERDR